MTFIRLCMLSKLLGILLPCVYTLKPDYQEMGRIVRRLECSLDEWLNTLPDYLDRSSSGVGDAVNGSSSLHFCFLSLKLLLCRVAFKIAAADPSSVLAEEKSYRLAKLRSAASNLMDFVSSLRVTHLQEFWLPCKCLGPDSIGPRLTNYFADTAHLLVSAATTLLRCLVETTDVSIKQNCAIKLVQFQHRLQIARTECHWDLAEFCLDRCSDSIAKIAAALEISTSAQESRECEPEHADTTTFGLDFDSSALLEDFLLPVDSLDYPFDTIWNV